MNEKTYIICDNQDLTKFGIVQLIKSQTKNAHIVLASDKIELKTLLAKNPISVVIIAFDNFDFEELEEIQGLHNTYLESKLLFIGSFVSESFINQLTQLLPEANFVLKKDTKEDLFTAITATENGKKFYCSEALDIILGNKPKKIEEVENRIHLLTPTEREIVQLLAYGKASKDIANERNLSYYTVITHRKNIFRKMEVNTVHELTKLALKYGLVDLTEYYI